MWHSGWVLMMAVGAAMAVLCVIFLLYYLAPPPTVLMEEHVSPSARIYPVYLRLAGLRLDIPANYLPYASERSGGGREQIVLYAELPDFRGYSGREAATFRDNDARSAILHILIKKEEYEIAESSRLDRIYLDAVRNRHGRKGPFGLVEYTFRNDSGYRGEDLFVGGTSKGIVVMRCTRPGAELPSAHCLREFQFAPDVSLSYRFALSQLSAWRRIADGVNRLAESFR
ncbi:MAG: hypothetical protein ACREHF_05625 [Rhizomicrobium sp.]